MRLCLMIEGQEDVTWDRVGGAGGGLRVGRHRDAVPLRPLPLRRRPDRARLAGRVDDAGRASPPAPAGSGWARWSRRSRSATRRCSPTRSPPSTTSPAGGSSWGSGAGWYQARARGLRVPVPAAGRAHGHAEEQLEIVTRRGPSRSSRSTACTTSWTAVRRCPSRVQQPHPPRDRRRRAASRAPSHLAARFAQEYNVVSVDPDECRAVRRSLDEAARAARSPAAAVLGDGDDADRPTRDELLERAGRLGALHFDGTSGEQLLAERVDGWICGTAGEVAQQLRELAEVGRRAGDAAAPRSPRPGDGRADRRASWRRAWPGSDAGDTRVECAPERRSQGLAASCWPAQLRPPRHRQPRRHVQVTPLWIHVEDGRPVFNTAVGRVKDRNIRARSRVSRSRYRRQTDYRVYVEIRGRAELARGRRPRATPTSWPMKYTGEPFRRLSSPAIERVKWSRSTPERVPAPPLRHDQCQANRYSPQRAAAGAPRPRTVRGTAPGRARGCGRPGGGSPCRRTARSGRPAPRGRR